jgi:1,4-alpha-glucan branching enzyme
MLRPFLYTLLLCALMIPVQANNSEPPQERAYNSYNLSILTRATAPTDILYLKAEKNEPGVKALKGILFTYAGRGTKQATIAGDFTSWKTEPMSKGKNGVWFYVLTGYEGQSPVRYKFCLDGIWTEDPVNPDRTADGNGSYISMAEATKYESKQLTYRFMRDGSVEFRIYNAKARFVSIAGDFNNWNPEHDILTRDGNDVWKITKRLPHGKFRYSYYIDGEWIPDMFNSASASDTSGRVCSVISVK